MNAILGIVSLMIFLAAIYFPVYQLLAKKLKAPVFIQEVITFFVISLFFANSSAVVDKPYHIIPFMTAKPVLSERNFVRNIPDTLTNNMQKLLVLMAAMIFLYTMIKFCFQLKEWVKGAYSDAITNCAAFFLYHLSILAVCFVVIPAFGYGQLFLFNDYTSADIMMSIQELISAFRTDGMNILYLSYKFYSVFFLMTVIGIFATRFAKKRETNKEIVSLTK